MYLGLNSKTIFVFMMCIFLVGTATAWTGDNRLKSYDEETKTLVIDDNFGLGGDLVKVKLEENTYTCGIECLTIWNVTIYQDDDNFLTDLVFQQIKGTGGISDYKFEYISSYIDVDVEDYEHDCKDRDELGYCKKVITGTHKEKFPIWSSFDPIRRLPIGNYIIKLTGTKKWEDSIDWIPTFYGEEIKQWAFWSGTSASTYWMFNEPNGAAEAVDFLGLKNLTVLTPTVTGFVPGKLNNAFNTSTGNQEKLNVSGGTQFAFDTDDFTIAFWINMTASGASSNMFGTLGQDTTTWEIIRVGNELRFESSGGIIDTTSTPVDSLFHRIVYTREGTGSDEFKVYVDTDNEANATFAGDLSNVAHNFTVRSPNGGSLQLDDLQIYDGFAFSLADVIFDYNGGAGIEGNTTAAPDLEPNIGNVVLVTPTNGTITAVSTIVFNSTATATTANFTNATIRIYDTSTTLFDSESVIVTGNTTNSSLFTIPNFVLGTYFWNVEFCGVANNATGSTLCNIADSNFTLTRAATINQSVNFSQTTIEGSSENFILNLTFNSTFFSLNSASFIYNNTLNTSVISGTENNRLITSSIIIPGVATDINKSFFWNLSFTDIVNGGNFIESTNITNQSVFNIGLDNCDVFTNTILNFTVRDEELQTFVINATLETAVNVFDQTRQGIVANFSGNFTNPVTICLSLNLTNTTVYSLDTIVRYEKDLQYANEYFNIVNNSLTINSTRQDIILFDLNISDSTEFQLTFTGSDFLPVENALIFVDRQYIVENVFKTVELPKTDSNGQTIVHLVRNNIIYNIRVSKNGVILGNFENLVAFCEDFAIGDCKIDLNAASSTEALFNYDTELGITFTTPTFNNNTRLVSFDFLTSDGTAKDVLMNVTRSDIFGNRTICEDSLLSSGGTLSCTIPANIDDADLLISVFVDGKQSVFKIIKLELTDLGVAGYLVWFVMALSLIMFFSDTKEGILIAILLGFAGGIGLGIVTSSLIGLGASGLWLIIIVIIGIWKLNKDRVQ